MLYLLRHGQTDYNLTRRLQGTSDIPLNQTGIDQAKKANEGLKNYKIDLCFCSPLQRAQLTAQLFLKGSNVPIYIDSRLIEIGFGIYEGDENAVHDSTHPIYPFFNDIEHYIPSNGAESVEHLYKRTNDLLKDIIPYLIDGKNILLVGHGAMHASIYNQLYSIPLKDYWKHLMKNCEIVEIENQTVFDLFSEKR